MLTPVQKSEALPAGTRQVVIIASKYNSRFVEGMLNAARQVFSEAQVRCEVLRVPGAFEIPVVAAKLAGSPKAQISALVCLGVILRGETTHAQHIAEAVSNALAQIQITCHIPVIHEVLLLENAEQAEVRCLGIEHNRGAEAAHTALEMTRTMEEADRILAAALPAVGVNKTSAKAL